MISQQVVAVTFAAKDSIKINWDSLKPRRKKADYACRLLGPTCSGRNLKKNTS